MQSERLGLERELQLEPRQGGRFQTEKHYKCRFLRRGDGLQRPVQQVFSRRPELQLQTDRFLSTRARILDDLVDGSRS